MRLSIAETKNKRGKKMKHQMTIQKFMENLQEYFQMRKKKNLNLTFDGNCLYDSETGEIMLLVGKDNKVDYTV